ncbi:hypothetical protein AAG570_005713 [Ranatra chinensis]|uniref:AB hydrolase-1 domain-containing protein n=1 Tax=Ranatra chinensis TaxID=642074 RepID=A0ABD0YD84_9HEMI
MCAGLWWGSKDVQPILALHGWQDNAGTWEPLLKMMPGHLSVLALDLPGSGLSSHLLPFQQYYFVDTPLFLRRIQLHYGFGPMTLLGHSGGSAMCFASAALYPEQVKGFFGIDYLVYAYKSDQRRAKVAGSTVDKAIELALRDMAQAKSYPREEAKRVWVEATRGSVKPGTVEILMKRAVAELPNGNVVFTRDNRLKAGLLEMLNVEQVEDIATKVRCPVVLIRAGKSHLFNKGIKNCPHILDTIKKHAKYFEFLTIDGLWYGPRDQKPVVGLHGLLDTGSTFEGLVSLLQVPAFLSLELPGHGQSSHIPLGTVFHYIDYVVWLRYVLKNYYKWDDLTLLGHSYGAGIWQYYSGLFPEQVKHFISIDTAIFMILAKPEKTVESVRYVFDQTLELEKRLKEIPEQEYDDFEEMVEKMYENRKKRFPMTREACRTILKRGVTRSPQGKYSFSRDLKINTRATGMLQFEYLLALAERTTCQVLFLECSEGLLKEDVLHRSPITTKALEKAAKRFKYDIVQGGHHVHLEHPGNVAPFINAFLNS